MKVSPVKRMITKKLPILKSASQKVAAEAKMLEDFGKHDERFNRMHLIYEEAAELGEALAAGNEVKALDGLTDLLYVILGTAVTFNLPLEEAFAEVHKSNMTKSNESQNHRVRDKGPGFIPPNLDAIIKEHFCERK